MDASRVTWWPLLFIPDHSETGTPTRRQPDEVMAEIMERMVPRPDPKEERLPICLVTALDGRLLGIVTPLGSAREVLRVSWEGCGECERRLDQLRPEPGSRNHLGRGSSADSRDEASTACRSHRRPSDRLPATRWAARTCRLGGRERSGREPSVAGSLARPEAAQESEAPDLSRAARVHPARAEATAMWSRRWPASHAERGFGSERPVAAYSS
jgi:hypothetical protein